MWPKPPKTGDPLTDKERELMRVVCQLAERGLFSYHNLRKEYAGTYVEKYTINTLRQRMHEIFVKLAINSVLELVMLVARDKSLLEAR
jgi:hypothetical protein